LRLPGELFVDDASRSSVEPSTIVATLSEAMRDLRVIPPREADRPAYIPKDLESFTRVFVRHDGVCKPLQPPYDGPYDVLGRADKHFNVKIDGSPSTVSIDRLKPFFLSADSANHQLSLTNPASLTSPDSTEHI